MTLDGAGFPVVLHFNVTEHPTAAWTAQHLVDTFPHDSVPSYLLRDRDKVYGDAFRQRVKGMGIGEALTAPSSPWQNPFAERLIGSIRRECLDHVLVLNERHLRRVLIRYFAYYHRARTHLALLKDTPERIDLLHGCNMERRGSENTKAPEPVSSRGLAIGCGGWI